MKCPTFLCSKYLKCPIFPIWFWKWEKWGNSNNSHVINFITEKEPKMKFFDFGAFQNEMQMLSHHKIIFQMVFWAFHITSRTCSHTEIRSFRIWKLEFFMEGIWIQPYRKCCSCHPRRRSNRLGVGHVVRWDQWKQGNRRHGHRNHERLQIVVVHLAARHSRQKCYRLRHRDILTDLLDYYRSYMILYPPKIRFYHGFTDNSDPNYWAQTTVFILRLTIFGPIWWSWTIWLARLK